MFTRIENWQHCRRRTGDDEQAGDEHDTEYLRCWVSKTQSFTNCWKRFPDWLMKKKADLMLNIASRFCKSSSFWSSISQVENCSIAWGQRYLDCNLSGFFDLCKPSQFLDGECVTPEDELVVHGLARKCFVVNLVQNLEKLFYMFHPTFSTLMATSCSRWLKLMTMLWSSSNNFCMVHNYIWLTCYQNLKKYIYIRLMDWYSTKYELRNLTFHSQDYLKHG